MTGICLSVLLAGQFKIKKSMNKNIDIDLESIIPEYNSKNPVVTWLFNKRLHIALKYLKNITPSTHLDIGCGNGKFIETIQQSDLNIKSLSAMDTNQNVVALNDNFQNCNFFQSDILNSKIESNEFDSVSCLDVLEHIKEIDKALEEIKRILKPNGYLIVSGPVESIFYKSLRYLIKGTYSEETGPGAGTHYYNIMQLNNIILKNGFEKIRIHKTPLFKPFDLFHIVLYRMKK
ncbi:class I SAM-dependent methyltransferase [bacterium]|nr:class I SAM-dependent methyltransferase [bacterium]